MISWFKAELLQIENRHRTVALILAAVFGVIWLALYYLSGIFTGYEAPPEGVGGSLASAAVMMIALPVKETFRAVLLSLSRKVKGNKLLFVFITVVFALPGIHISQLFTGELSGLIIVRNVLSELLPALMTSAVYTVLIGTGGVCPAYVYGAATLILPRLIPVIPGSVLLTRLTLSFLMPVFFVIATDILTYTEPPVGRHQAKKEKFNPLSVVIPVFLFAIIALFFAGLFPVKPTVVATGSMEPNIMTGDIAVVGAADCDSLTEGDVIQYADGHKSVVHRIVRIAEQNGERLFITKGDANNVEDKNPVHASQVEGKLLMTVPGVGQISMLLHSDAPVYTMPSLWG